MSSITWRRSDDDASGGTSSASVRRKPPPARVPTSCSTHPAGGSAAMATSERSRSKVASTRTWSRTSGAAGSSPVRRSRAPPAMGRGITHSCRAPTSTCMVRRNDPGARMGTAASGSFGASVASYQDMAPLTLPPRPGSPTFVSGNDGQHRPPPRHPLELVLAAVGELEAGAGDERRYRTGHENLPGGRQGAHPCGDVHGDAGDVGPTGHDLDLAGVQPGAHLE